MSTPFTEHAGVRYPIIGGAMYPCSNPELVAAISEGGGLGIVQPLSLVYAHGREFRAGLRAIRSLTSKPIGMNVIVEKNARIYEKRMQEWVAIALEEGVRFFVTALGDPSWVLKEVHAAKGFVYHDVTDRRWAERVVPLGIDGLICVNARAGGHAGTKEMETLFAELSPLGLPLVAAGGVSTEADVRRALALGYAAVQMGTRFIATTECTAPAEYKQAILDAEEDDIVRTERVTGVPLAVIRTPYVEKVGLSVGPVARFLFRYRRTRHWLRFIYNVRAVRALKRSINGGMSTKDYYQAGKSVAGVHSIEPAGDIVRRLGAAAES